MTTINIRIERIEERTKVQAAKTLAKLGLDMSSAVKIFLNQVVHENGFPFIPTINPSALRDRWDAQVKEAFKEQGSSTAKELHAAILKR